MRGTKNNGFSLPGAIFIMLALSAIGVAMVTLNSVTTTTSALNIEQTRAYYAAQSALEWALKKVSDNDSAFNSNSCDGLNSLTSIDSFTITVNCTATCPDSSCCLNVSECAVTPRVTIITVTASKGSSEDTYYVFRTMQTTTSYDGS